LILHTILNDGSVMSSMGARKSGNSGSIVSPIFNRLIFVFRKFSSAAKL